MENLEPDRQPRLGILDKNRKIQPKNVSLRTKVPVENQSDQTSVSCKFDNIASKSKMVKNILIVQNTASSSRIGMSHDVASTSKDDSLKDFRSPVKEIDMNESLADFEVSKPTKRLARKESKPIAKKKRQNRDVLTDVKQPSIESSFFRPKIEIQTSFVCPLCYKSYKDGNARTNHMKGCAARNNLSTKQLLDALILQEKQARERKAMGLLVAPPVQPKKTVSRKMVSDKDPQLELALALSMSLHEAQVSEEIEEAHLLAGENYSPVSGEMSEERRKTLQNFGFTTNKPAVASTGNKSRKKRLAGPTVLQTRTQDERDRITTVRIAEVLMGDEPITQALLKNEEKVVQPVENINLRSRLLRSYHRLEDRLWDKTQQTLNGQSSYPCNPSESSPCKMKSESKIEKTEQKSPEQKTPIEAVNNPSDTSDEKKVFARQDSENSSENSTDNDAPSVQYKVDKNSVMDLAKDWRPMFGASYLSDVSVVVKGNHTIHAHRVVFWARCYNLMNDVIKNDPERFREVGYRLSWPETDLNSASAFLEYLYCGIIELHVGIFDCPDLLAEVRSLARKYELKKLFVYLRDKSKELKSKAVQISDQKSPKTRIDSKSRLVDTSDDSSSSSNGAMSICSKGTDINSLSTEYNDPEIGRQCKREKIFDRDNVCEKRLKFTEKLKGENMSVLSSSKANLSTGNNASSGKRRSQGTPGSIVTTLGDPSGDGDLSKSALTPRKKNSTKLQGNGYLKVIDHTIFERERSVSPDIFDDSESETATCSYAVSKEPCYDFKREISESNMQVEFVRSSAGKLETESELPNEENDLLDREISVADTVADILEKEEDRTSIEKLKIDLSFVSTRRAQRNLENSISFNRDNFNSDTDSSNREKSLLGRFSTQKGEMALAIEKIQRLNAKTASESDSDCESVEVQIKKRRNPFRLHVTADTSSFIEENIEENVNSELDTDGPQRRRNKLSIFEEKIEIAAKKNPSMFNLPTHTSETSFSSKKPSESSKPTASTSGLQNMNTQKRNDTLNDESSLIKPSQKLTPRLDDSDDSVFDLTQGPSRGSKSDSDRDTCDTNPDEKDLSMFTRYKRKHSRNSIDKYRAALKNALLATSISSSKNAVKALSSNDSKIFDSESSDEATEGVNSVDFSSKYEYTVPDRSTSSFQKKLSNMSLKSKEPVNVPKSEKGVDISVQILSSAESEDSRERGITKLGDVGLSEFEIDLSDFSSLRYSDKFNESKSRANGKSQGEILPGENSENGTLDDKKISKDTTEEILDARSRSANVKPEDTKIAIAQRNLSEEETDTECWIESVVSKNTKRLSKNEEKVTDIHNEETDAEEMGDKESETRISRTKNEVNNAADVSKTIANLQPSVKDRLNSSSPECEITGVFESDTMMFDFVKNISDEVGLLLEECKTTNKKLQNSSSMSQIHDNSEPSISDRFASTPTHLIHKNDYSNSTSHNAVSDYEEDNLLANQCFSEAHCSKRNLSEAKPKDIKNKVETSNKKKYSFSESDSSDYEDFIMRKKKSRTSFSPVNKSKAIKDPARSTPSRFESFSPEKNSPSPLRTFKAKSLSENILKSKSMSKSNHINDSFDETFTRAGTSSVNRNNSEEKDQRTPPRELRSENVTPLADYSAMKTPELTKELDKYGFKPQKRHRAKQLLRYIYNELHPLVPVADTNIPSYSNVSNSDDEMPAPKRLNRSKSLEAINNGKCKDNSELDHETLASNTRSDSDASDCNEFEDYDVYNLSQSDDTKSLETLFRRLIQVDKDLHNKVLTYEPLELEKLHSTLKSQGLKCKLNALMSFLDEQCITFRQMTNAKKSRTKRKVNLKKNSKSPLRRKKNSNIQQSQ